MKKITYPFELDAELSKQLYESYPQNVSFKNGLAVSYAKLGVFNKNQLKDNQKAKIYFQQAHDLWRELTTDYPTYVEFQGHFKNVKSYLEDQ